LGSLQPESARSPFCVVQAESLDKNVDVHLNGGEGNGGVAGFDYADC
jgi:hypothetical protein